MSGSKRSNKSQARTSAMRHRKVSPLLRRHLQTMNKGARARKKIKVIIEFKRLPSREQLRALRGRIASRPHHFRVRRKLKLIRSVAAHMHAGCLRKLCAHGLVKRVHLDRKLRTTLNVATPAIGSTALQRRGVTGKGVTIGIIDTGVFPHPDLVKPVNRITAFRDFVGNRKKPYDDNGHGTHVAGDAAGNGFSSNGRFTGPAPRSRLVVAKAFNRNGSANTSDVIAALGWILRTRKKFGTRIVNMSFGAPGVTNCANDPLCAAATKAWNAGLVVVAAAGNSGPGARTIESPGINPKIITVGAADDRGTIRQADDTVAGFSSRGPIAGGKVKPDLVAPGVGIISLRAPGSLLDIEEPQARVGRNYFRMSGTSMATPIVSGAIAQILQRRPKLCPGQIKSKLKRTAVKLRGFGPNAQGQGEIHV
ncbi:S8 family peptidase [Paenibacillus sp. HJGM_3]|uniref:S8 family peptidase n=1 Tax=Paenibacillus sp. HJGM_3 TaxID=3379816 RepID=UPI00385D7D33